MSDGLLVFLMLLTFGPFVAVSITLIKWAMPEKKAEDGGSDQ